MAAVIVEAEVSEAEAFRRPKILSAGWTAIKTVRLTRTSSVSFETCTRGLESTSRGRSASKNLFRLHKRFASNSSRLDRAVPFHFVDPTVVAGHRRPEVLHLLPAAHLPVAPNDAPRNLPIEILDEAIVIAVTKKTAIAAPIPPRASRPRKR